MRRGYRIRPLTEAEKEVKVTQLVGRQREWEDGLVSVYKSFLEMCETEVSEESPLAPAAIHCLCNLVKEKPDFNLAINIMDVIVKRVGRKGWDEVIFLYDSILDSLLMIRFRGINSVSPPSLISSPTIHLPLLRTPSIWFD